MALQPGQQVGRYRIVRMLAQGGMAEVYRAEQELAAGIFRPAALKVIRPEYSGSNDFREMFLDEARTASTLAHSNIAHIYDVGEADGLLYMAMELVSGETLAVVCRALRETGDRFSDEALFAIGINTCSALEAVHALKLPGEGHLNLVHRDVSPHNLLLSAAGQLKLIDFGIAKAATNRNLTMPGVTKGKAGYFSPEQAMGRALDGRSDLFSLGVTLYKLASGGTPFDEHKTHQARNQALVHGRWEPLEKACAGLPRALYEIIGRSLKVRPEDRFADARAMREALEQAALQAGLHVGQSSLAGYVDAEGEIGAPPPSARAVPQTQHTPTTRPDGSSQPTSARPLATPAAVSGRRHTERVVPLGSAPSKRPNQRLLAGVAVFIGATLAGVLALLLIASQPAEPKPLPPVPAQAPVVPDRVARVEPPPVRPPPVRPPEHGEDRGHDDPPPERTPTPVVRRPRPPPVVVAEEKIPKGMGMLRVGAVPDGLVSVGSQTWGQAPVNRKISSGQYRVNVLGAGGKKGSCFVTVLPDKTTIVIYNFETSSCR
ncbi:MAG: serine/threonine protein kinase [Myxococcaceae bacterium]